MPRNRLEPILLTARGPMGHAQALGAQAILPGRNPASRTAQPSTESLLRISPTPCFIFSILVMAVLAPGLHSQGFPPITIRSVVNAASFQPGLPSGGALATVYCDNLFLAVGQAGPVGTITAPPGAPLPFELMGVRVLVNGAYAPILAIANPGPHGQINFQVPMERNATASQYVVSGTVTIVECVPIGCVAYSAPYTTLPNELGGFFSDAKGYAIAQHASDFTPVTVQNPAHAGEAIIAYADDFFPVWPPPPMAIPAPVQPLFTFQPVLPQSYAAGGLYLQQYPTPSIKGVLWPTTPPLQVAFAGLAPGQIGVEQINFVVPADQAPGDWALFYSNAVDPERLGSNTSPYVLLPVR